MSNTVIGFVGLGAMGGRIAGRPVDAGLGVHGTNRSRSKGEWLVERGMRRHDTPRNVAAAADVAINMVTDDQALEAIASGPDGIIAGLATRKVHVDMSTVSPSLSRALSTRVGAAGADMLDAPVSGSIP